MIEHEVGLQEEQEQKQREQQQQEELNEDEDDILSPELRTSIDAVLARLDSDILIADEEMLPPTDDDEEDEDAVAEGGKYLLGRDRLFPVVKPPKPEVYDDSKDCRDWESWEATLSPAASASTSTTAAAEPPSSWSWLSFLVYRNHPYMQDMVRTHICGNTLTKAQLRDKIEEVMLRNCYSFKAFQVAVKAITAENKTETSENGECLQTRIPIPQVILDSLNKSLNTNLTTTTRTTEPRRLLSKLLCEAVVEQRPKMPRLVAGMDIGLAVMAELAAATEEAPVYPDKVFSMYGHIWCKITRGADFSDTLKRGIAAAAEPLSIRANIAEADQLLKRYMLYALTAHGRAYGMEDGVCGKHMNLELLTLTAFREGDIYGHLTSGLKELVKCVTWKEAAAAEAAAAAAAAEEPPKRPPHEALFELGEHMLRVPPSESECAFALQADLYSDLTAFSTFVNQSCSYSELPHITHLHYTSYHADRNHVYLPNPNKDQLAWRMEELSLDCSSWGSVGSTRLHRRINSFYKKLTCYCMQCMCSKLCPIRYGSTNC